MTAAEMGLALYTSLQGEAEAEAEHLELSKINHKNGVSYILDQLRGPLQQKVLFQKRKLLADFEGVRRHNAETVRQYVNRYRRIERDLQTIGIETGSMYDSEARGNRILERCQLSPDLQRLVLIGAGNCLDYEKITESMCMQFPDFKPTPMVWTSSHNRQQADNQTSASSSSSSNRSSTGTFRSSSTATSSGKGRFTGKGKSPKTYPHGKGPPRSVFQTEQVEDEADNEEDDAEDFEDAEGQPEDGEELEPIPEEGDGDYEEADVPSIDVDTLADLAQVLTVTSKKLQASVLGRKFTGRKSIEERKKTSTCSACGQTGHWAGDSACSMSASKRDGGGKGQKGAGGSSFSSTSSPGQKYVKKAYVVGVQHGEHSHEPHDDETTPSSSSTYFTFTTNQIFGADATSTTWITESIDLGGYMVLDTACQRSCCGEVWLKTHAKILERHGLRVKMIESSDHFQFGSGKPIAAAERAYIPIEMEGQETKGLLFGVSVLSTNIPFLASRTLLERLGCIIDMFTKTITFANLGVTLPLTHKHGHLAVNIAMFSEDLANHPCWKHLSRDQLWHEPDPELMFAPGAFNKGSIRDLPPQALLPTDVPCDSSRMAEAMADTVCPGDDHRDQGRQSYVEHGALWTGNPVLADPGREHQGDGASTLRGCQQDAKAGQSSDMHAPRVQEVRQRQGFVQPMQEMPTGFQVGPKSKRMAPTWKSAVASFFALATALIFQHPGAHQQGNEFFDIEDYNFQVPSEAQSPTTRSFPASDGGDLGSGSLSSRVRWRRGWIPRMGRSHGDPRLCMNDEADWWEVGKNMVTRVHNMPRKSLFNMDDFYNGEPCPVHVKRLSLECTAEMNYEDGRTQMLTYDWSTSGASAMKQYWTGKTIFRVHPLPERHVSTNLERKSLRHAVRQVAHLLQVEHDVMLAGTTSSSTSTSLKNRPRVDSLETFAGRAGITMKATKLGLKALQPIDYNTGYDLEKASHQQHVDYLIDHFKPLFLVQGIDCRDWCLLQDNTNYVRRKILLLMRREKARKLLRRVVRWCVKQAEAGRFFLLENPATSRLWLEPLVLRLSRLPGVYAVVCHSGAYGGTNS